MVTVPETGWTGEPLDPERVYNPDVVEDIRKLLVTVPVVNLETVFEAAGEQHGHELAAALGMAVAQDLSEQLRHAGFDTDDSRRRDLAARIAELQRLTGSEGLASP